MKYFVIAGEASGDLHGSDLVVALKANDPSAEIIGMGGDKMEHAGMVLFRHYSEYSFMGFVEVLFNLSKIRRLLKAIKAKIKTENPDHVVLIDYGGFNLKIAKFCKELGVPVHFYILPKVWAWNEKRVRKIRDYVDQGYCIFPFEEAYFKGHGVNAVYVGNPVVNQINRFLSNHTVCRGKYIALLPGSRDQEIYRILPTLLRYARKSPDKRFKLAAHDVSKYDGIDLPENVEICDKSTYETVANAKAAIVTSGTANLETALLKTPQVVVYQANRLSYEIGKRVVKIKYISPVNLILDRLLIKELIQSDFDVVHLEEEVEACLTGHTRKQILEGYNELADILENKNAGEVVAKHIIAYQ